MENYIVNYEKLCYKNITSLTSILDIKSTEMISINEKRINNFDLWLSDSNLLLIDNIKKNNPNVDLPSKHNGSQINSPLNCRRENSLIKDSYRIFRYEKTDDILNASDLIIANFVKNLNRDFICFKKININNDNPALLDSEILKNSFGLKSPRENETNLISKDFNYQIFTEKISVNIKELNNNTNLRDLNLSLKCEHGKCDSKNKRKRDWEDVQIMLAEEFALKQIKLENESIDCKPQIIKTNDLQNLTSRNIHIKPESTDRMDIENEKIHSKAFNFNDNNHFSINSTNNTQYLQNSYLNTGNNNYFNQSINSNIILEQPSKEQDITLTPQNSNRFISLNGLNNKNLTNDNNKEKKQLQEFSNKINEPNISSKPIIFGNAMQENHPIPNNQIGILRENTQLNNKILNNHFTNPLADEISFNKTTEINTKENNNWVLHPENIIKTGDDDKNALKIMNYQLNPKLLENTENGDSAHNSIQVIKPEHVQKISLKSEYTFRNADYNNTDSNVNHNYKNVPISIDSSDKLKIKKTSDGIKRLTLSKNYVEDNVNNKEFIISSINKSIFESLNTRTKNDVDIKDDDKMDIHSEKTFEYQTINSIKNIDNKYDFNKDKIKNEIAVNSDSNLKNSKNQINNKNLSNKENEDKGQNEKKNLNKENQNKNQKPALKEQLSIKNVSNFKENLKSKNALNIIDSNNQGQVNKKENVLNSLLNKNFESKRLEKTLEQSKLENKNNKIFLQKKNDDSKKVSNFKTDNQQLLVSKQHADQKGSKLEGNEKNIINELLKAEKNHDLMDLKIKKILSVSSNDESQSNYTQTDREKETMIATLKHTNNEFKEVDNRAKQGVTSENPKANNLDLNLNNNKNNNAESNILNQKEEVQKEINLNENLTIHNEQLEKGGIIQQCTENLSKEESNLYLNNKCISHDFQQSRVIEIENNLVKNLCVYELTDETPNSSDYDESNDGLVDFADTPLFNHKKKKVNPQWALDKSYVKQKIIEQNYKKLYEEVFGQRLKIEYLDLRSIFSTEGSEFDLRGESADWKIDNTLSSRRYNKHSRFDKIDEELNDNNDENQMFSNFKKTNRNLYNDFHP